MSAKRKPEPFRKRLTIPQADVSTLEWFDLQDDASASVRLLIRESIQRDGYTDVINRPVEQQPRRGRPPVDGSPRPSSPQRPADDDEDGDEREPDRDEDESDGNRDSHVDQASADEAAETANDDTDEDPQLDDIFGSMRN